MPCPDRREGTIIALGSLKAVVLTAPRHRDWVFVGRAFNRAA
jgi:hypothetical protein